MDGRDKATGALLLRDLWTALGHRVAATMGASTALVSLLFDASLQIACLRGALAWLALLLVTRAGGWLLVRTDVARNPAGSQTGAASPDSGAGGPLNG